LEVESTRDIKDHAYAKHTNKATAVGMKSWIKYCEEYNLNPTLNFEDQSKRLSETKKLSNFLQHERKRKSRNSGKLKMNSYSSFVCYYEDIKRFHVLRGIKWLPTYLIHMKFKSLKRQYAKGKNRKLPLLSTMVNKMEKWKILDPVSNADDELIVMVMLLSIYGLFRISELLNEPEFTIGKIEGKCQITVKLTDSKTLIRNDGLPELVVISELGKRGELSWCPLDILFRRLFRSKKKERKQVISMTRKNGTKLTRSFYSRRLKEALMKIGINPSKYDTHSGRIGGATMLWDAGFSDAQIKRFGRWKSDSWSTYCRAIKSKCLELSKRLRESELSERDIVVETEEMVISPNEETI